MRALLDTPVVIANGIVPLQGELSVSAVTLAELHYGVLVAAHPAVRAERLRRLSVLQQRLDALPVDDAVACWRSSASDTSSADGDRRTPAASTDGTDRA